MTSILNRQKINFRSNEDLNALVLDSIRKIPEDIDLVVAVPRSGYLVAGLIALNLNLPMCSYNEFLNGLRPTGGRRAETIKAAKEKPQKVLIVDDSVSSGWEVERIRGQLREAQIEEEIVLLAAFVNPEKAGLVDIALELTPRPQIFEWNLYHHPHLKNACFDIDGVLCRDATKEEDDDGPRYLEFIENVEHRIIPSVEVGWLVTSRLEKYRAPTEAWLKRHGVQYRELIMQDLPDLETRLALKSDGPFKANFYSSCEAFLFVESSVYQARTIFERTGKAVFCTDTRTFVNARTLEIPVFGNPQQMTSSMRRLRSKVRRGLSRLSGR